MQEADGRFVVISDNSTSSQAFTWEVKAVRADIAQLITENRLSHSEERMFMSSYRHANPVKNAFLCGLACWLAAGINADFAWAQLALKSESFDRDPGWEAHNNRLLPKEYPTVVQDFGYSNTNLAGKSPGEMGGLITRAFEPAFYADKIGPKTLDDKLSASGTFAVTKTVGGGGLFFGFFRAEQPGGGGRPICSLGMNVDCEQKGCRLAVRLITGKNQSCGTFITPYLPGKFRPTPLKNDGTRYHWKLDYDPQAADGKGRFTFTLTSESHKTQDYGPLPVDSQKEALARFQTRPSSQST